jgi:hypothetical protein
LGTNFKAVEKKYNYQLGFALQQTVLENYDASRYVRLTQRYINLFPTASFNYQFRKNKFLQINYRGNNNVPSITQLQDITDVTSYPYIRKGNPYLKQEFLNKVTLTYNSFNLSTLQNLFINIYFSGINNKIVNSIEQTSGEQVIMPVNLSGVYTLGSSFNLGFPLQKMEGGSFQSTTYFDYIRDASLINNSKNLLKYVSVGQEIGVNYNYREKLFLALNATLTYNGVKHTIQKDQNSAYFVHNYSVDASFNTPFGLTLSTTAEYTAYGGRTDGFGKNSILWNASVSKQVFKNRRGEIKASVMDILNQSFNNARTVGDNYINDVQNNTLKRFGLLTFTYNLNKFGADKHASSQNSNQHVAKYQ